MTLKKKLALAAAIVVLGSLGALMLLTPRIVPEEPLPNPNGYNDFVQAASIVAPGLSDWNTIPVGKLRELVTTNEPVLQIIQTGLGKECRVVPYTLAGTNSSHMSDLANHKRVALAFCCAQRLALLDGRTNEAAIMALDCIRFGEASVRGGVVIDSLVGLAIKSIGLARLKEALPGTDIETSRNIVATLDDVIGKQESCADIFKREKQWARRGRFGPAGLITQLIQPLLQRGMLARTEQKFASGMNALQQAKLQSAAHTYELDHGKPPTAASDLVPQYLKSVPLDATTGKELPLD